jgi:hypothetical protein
MGELGDTVILHDELAYGDVLPVAFRPLADEPSDDALAAWSERNLRLLQGCAALEEHGGAEKPDEDSPHAADLRRIDLKVNLLLDMVGHLVAASQARPAARPVRFNAHGIVWTLAPGEVAPRGGTLGLVEIHLKPFMVEPLALAGSVADAGAGAGAPGAGGTTVHVRFEGLHESVADHIEKLVFRRHRRQIAGVRQLRR